jgi:predicted outer membrane repeat protein
VHTLLLSLYFGGYATLFFIENLTSLGSAIYAERLEFLLVIALYSAWAVCLSQKGQTSEPWPELDVMVLKSLAQGR